MEGTPAPASALAMESLLELRRLGPDDFITVHPPWLPPGAPSIYGGTLIAHCFLAAQATVPPDCSVTSLHSTFVDGGKPSTPIHYTVQRLPSYASSSVRAVRALQEGKCIFVAALRFLHPLPTRPHRPPEPEISTNANPEAATPIGTVKGGGDSDACPFLCGELHAVPDPGGRVHETKISQWMKTRHRITADDPTIHLAAIAYMSDNYFLPTATRVHGVRWGRDPEALPAPLASRRSSQDRVKMMVSLDHSIYFAQPREPLRADEWLRTEMQSPWAGDGRALVLQSIFSNDGTLIATALQEGVLRWDQPVEHKL